jgi:uncharacterized protein
MSVKTDIAEREEVNPAAGEKKYGDVRFADEKNKKYPIDTPDHVRAAWNYIARPENARKYSAEDVNKIKAKIVSAWRKLIDEAGPPSVRADGVLRFDTGPIGKAEMTPEGWLKVPAAIARTGVYEYMNGDGTVRRELRTPEEVFSPEAMRSVALRPVTDDHPWSENPPLLTPKNAAKYTRGSAGENVHRAGDFVETTLMITDEALIAKIDSGTNEVSAGYVADTIFESGVWQGQPYDCRQENIRMNHIAIVQKGRAGDDVRLKLDSASAVAIRRISDEVPPPSAESTEKKERAMADKKVTIAGVDYDVSEQVAQAIAKLTADHTARVDAMREPRCDKCDAMLECPTHGKTRTDALKGLEDELTKEKARADMAESKLKDVEKAHADSQDPKWVADLVKARVALESRAREILGADVKLDATDDSGIKRRVLAKLSPDVKIDGKDSVYIDAAYDYAVANAGKSALAALQKAVGPKLDGEAGGEDRPDARAAKAKMEEEARNAWKGTIKGAA